MNINIIAGENLVKGDLVRLWQDPYFNQPVKQNDKWIKATPNSKGPFGVVVS